MTLRATTWFGCTLIAAVALAPLSAQERTVRHSPELVDADAAGVRRLMRDAVVTDREGNQRTLFELTGERPTAILLTSTTCPLCQKFGPALTRIEQRWAGRVDFVWLNVSGLDDDAAIQEQVEGLGIQGTYVIDGRASDQLTAAQALGAETTTEAFVFDAGRTLVYRGPVSDQYGINYARETARESYLEDALAAAVAGRRPTVEAMSSPGCALDLPSEPLPDVPVNYHNRIARIVMDHCGACHRDQGTAPFALDSYERVAKRAGAIGFALEERLMPPWFANPLPDDPAHRFANDPSLSDSERADLIAWLKSDDRPRGDEANHPVEPEWEAQWLIGTPDLVIELPNAVSIPADGVVDYVIQQVGTGLGEDRWIKAMQVLPTARENVHHALVIAVDRQDLASGNLRDIFRETNGFFAAYVPGNDVVVYPDGYARQLRADQELFFQMHYTTNGSPASDQTKLGIVFSDEPPHHVVDSVGVTDRDLAIPPYVGSHPEAGRARLLQDIEVLAFLPHMHVRGVGFRYEAETKDGERRTLLDVPHYDFNWQLRYMLREPLRIETGTLLTATGWFDNSDRNPANPDPSEVVRFGEQTYEEMMIGYLEYTIAAGAEEAVFEHLRDSPTSRFLGRFDANGDGIVEESEVPESALEYFYGFDHDGDGLLTPDDVDLAEA